MLLYAFPKEGDAWPIPQPQNFNASHLDIIVEYSYQCSSLLLLQLSKDINGCYQNQTEHAKSEMPVATFSITSLLRSTKKGGQIWVRIQSEPHTCACALWHCTQTPHTSCGTAHMQGSGWIRTRQIHRTQTKLINYPTWSIITKLSNNNLQHANHKAYKIQKFHQSTTTFCTRQNTNIFAVINVIEFLLTTSWLTNVVSTSIQFII